MSEMRDSEEVDEMNRENEAQLMDLPNEGDSEKDLVQQYVISFPIGRVEMIRWLDMIEQEKQAV
jgi:hypothetical protein